MTDNLRNHINNGNLEPDADFPELLRPALNSAEAAGLTVDETGWKFHGHSITQAQYRRALRDLGSIWYDTNRNTWGRLGHVSAAALKALTRNFQ